VSTPFVFISTHAVKKGTLEAVKQWSREFAELTEANEPRLLAWQLFINEDQSEVSSVLILPDAAAMDVHLQVAGEMIGKGLELAPTISLQSYGAPGPVLQNVLNMNAEAGVTVTVKSSSVNGFTRVAWPGPNGSQHLPAAGGYDAAAIHGINPGAAAALAD
jgi:hypothetical protein